MAIIPFSHQIPAFNELAGRAGIYFDSDWRQLPIRPRFHSLVVGPTGAGKSTLVQAVAQACQAAYIRVSCPGWVPLGARENTAKETFPALLQTVLEHDRTLLFLDEMDKISHEVSWMEYVRGEIFDMLDGIIRPNLKIPGEPLEEDDETVLDRMARRTFRATAEAKLKDSVFFVGAGTFQGLFDVGSKTAIGFGENDETHNESITANALSERLPRELVNRFSAELILLPEMKRRDYRNLIEVTAAAMPVWIRQAFADCAEERLEAAIVARKGCRFVEESILAALKLVQPLSVTRKNVSAPTIVKSPESQLDGLKTCET